MYAAADRMLGHLVKVTPSSKVVGDLALQLVATGADPAEFEADPAGYDLPDSVVAFLHGELGDPPGGWPEPFRTKALAGRGPRRERTPLTAEDQAELDGGPQRRRERLNALLFPGPAQEFSELRREYGDISVIDTLDYLYGLRPGEEVTVTLERGVRLLIGLEAVSEPDERGVRTVMTTLNNHLRPVQVRDDSATVTVEEAERADRSEERRVGKEGAARRASYEENEVE